jgi:hypothetical protein
MKRILEAVAFLIIGIGIGLFLARSGGLISAKGTGPSGVIAALLKRFHISPPAAPPPDWVNRGSGAFKIGGVQGFYGVGIASGIRNPALKRTAADDRGRAELAKIMNSYVTVLEKTFVSSAGDMDTSRLEKVSRTSKSFAKATLRGAECMDHWTDPNDTLYALCRLDMENWNKSLNLTKSLDSSPAKDMEDMEQGLIDFLRNKENCSFAFDRLSIELEASKTRN